MACMNSSISSLIFVSDLPSYGLIGLVSIGLILYVAYIITYTRNEQSSTTVYVNVSQLCLLFILLTPITFLFRPLASIHLVCPLQTLSVQVFPFCLLLGFNVHFAHQWLRTSTKNSHRKTCLISLSSLLICFLAALLQTAILLIWFYNHNYYQQVSDPCANECHRPLFLCSLSFNFFLLFLLSLQSSIRYHFYTQRTDLIYLLTSLLALCVTIGWICLYLFLPLHSSLTFYMNHNYVLAYGTLFFVYSFLGPFLFEQLFYRQRQRAAMPSKDQLDKVTIARRVLLQCLRRRSLFFL